MKLRDLFKRKGSLIPTPEDPVEDEGKDIEPVEEINNDLEEEKPAQKVEETPFNDDSKKKKNPKKDVKLKLKYRTKENDIGYRAPLSYRHLRILGWIFLAATQMGLVFTIASKIDHTSGFDYDMAKNVVEMVASFPFVLFILANFGIILRNRNNFKYLFIFYGGVMAVLYLLANLVVLHYAYGSLHTIDSATTFQDVALLMGTLMISMGTTGYMFNLFIDLFLCVLTVFFIFYCPKNKYFQGKNIIWFRLLVILPLAYEIASIIIKQNCLLGNYMVPSYVFFLLTSKPPLTFAAFFIITIILKNREYKFLKLFNFDHQKLEEHLSTRAHSLRTSITIAVVFLVISNIDTIVLFGYIIFEGAKAGDVDEYGLMFIYDRAKKIGLGESSSLFIAAPIALLYSYTKVHEDKKIDSFLPLIGIALVIFTIIEGLYLTLRFTIFESIGEYIDLLGSMGEEGDGTLYPTDGEEGTELVEEIKRVKVPKELLAIKNSVYSLFHQIN